MHKGNNQVAAIILAAGLGKRMNSSIPKVLHTLAGEPMITRTMNILEKLNLGQAVVVVGHKGQMVKNALKGRKIDYAFQKNQLGTADAAKAGLAVTKKGIKTVIVLNGDDSSFYRPQTLQKIIQNHIKNRNILTFASSVVVNPQGLGRVIKKNGKPIAIIEEKEATQAQRKIKEINCGLYVIDLEWLQKNLKKVKKAAVSGEYYLVNLVAIAIRGKQKVEAFRIKDSKEWHGINTIEELELANQFLSKTDPKIHFMGVAGAGESAVAALALKAGLRISGCDLNPDSSYTQGLKLNILKGHSPSHLQGISSLVMSPAVIKLNPQNPEIVYAKKHKIPILTWQKFQADVLQKDKFVIAISGGYGKSTTTAMISKILQNARLDPTCVVGARLLDWNQNFRWGKSNYYVTEADEYNNNFLNYKPNIALILNAAWDHPDFFNSKDKLLSSYREFVSNITPDGILVVGDDPSLKPVIESARSDIAIVKIMKFPNLHLSIIGGFRRENAAAALTVSSLLKINLKEAIQSVESFKGLERRLEYKGAIGTCKFYDDYAVQPYTIKSTANALREKFPNEKIALVLEPHTFSRVETFFKEFKESLKAINVDKIFITEVYGARESGDRAKLSQKLANEVGRKSDYTGNIENTALILKNNLRDYDIVLTMGAGDIYKIFKQIQKNQKS